MLPVVGLSFSNHAVCGDPAALKQVLRTMVDTDAVNAHVEMMRARLEVPRIDLVMLPPQGDSARVRAPHIAAQRVDEIIESMKRALSRRSD